MLFSEQKFDLASFKEEIALNIKSIVIDRFYWILFLVAVIISTLGLLQNSSAVIIGAMLIAPLLRPISSASFAIANMHQSDLWKSLKVLFLSIILAILVSYFITKLLPYQLNTNELLSRTNPNILDLFIALFSSIVAFIALIYKDWIAESVAGVAIATSLVPPLAVVGVEIAYQNYFLAWESFLLFFTNLITILFTGILLFLLVGFKPHQEEDKRLFKINIILLLLLFSIIILPLTVSIISLKNNIDVKNILNKELKESEVYEINSLNLVNEKNKYIVKLNFDLLDDEKENLLKNKILNIKKEIEGIVNKNVEFEIKLYKYQKMKI